MTYSEPMKRLSVEVQDDHLQRLVTADPLAGVAELIWNALDADAANVRVKLVTTPMDALEQLIVEDDGHGMTVQSAERDFQRLGGSWKQKGHKSQGGARILHGSEGKGRWRAFAIGDEVIWSSVALQLTGQREEISIRGTAQQLGEFELSGPDSTDERLGTTVTVNVGTKSPNRLLTESAALDLTTRLALYLQRYPTIQVIYRGEPLSPDAAQARRNDLVLPIGDGPPAKLVVIEWKDPVERGLFLCDENGTTLEQTTVNIHAPGFEFTAYVCWAGFRDHENVLLTADLAGSQLGTVVEAAREKLREHFKKRHLEVSGTVIQQWKAEKVYPYAGEPQNRAEVLERDLFDIVAVVAAPAVNADGAARSSKRFSLRLLKEALAENPTALGRILRDVLELPEGKLRDLSDLLDKTSLTAVITAARLISDRLEFVRALEVLAFEPETKAQLKERSQLHRILASETWLFGEEFALAVDDESLGTALSRHIELLGRERLDPRPVTDSEGKTRILDLMLSRSIPQPRNRLEHLVVELKAPREMLTLEHLNQIKKYAHAVQADDRFEKSDVAWDFYLVSDSLSPQVETEIAQQNRPEGLAWDVEGLRIWVKTYGQLVQDARHRLKFVQAKLEYEPERDEALDYLRRFHARYLPPSLLKTSETAMSESKL